jgi:hypothetical protein
MRIDQVVGNPPFGEARDNPEATNSNSLILYDKFIYKSCDVSDKVALIVPAGWSAKVKETNRYKAIGLKRVTFHPMSVFPTVAIRSGITVLYFEKGYTGDIQVDTTLGSSYTQPRCDTITNIRQEDKQFLNRLHAYSNIAPLIQVGSVQLPRGTKGSKHKLLAQFGADFSETHNSTHSNQLLTWLNGSKEVIYTYTHHTCKYTTKHKAVGALIAGVGRMGKILTVPPGIGIASPNFLIPAATAEEAELYQRYLSSKLVAYIINLTKFNDILVTNNNTWRHIPNPPIDQWVGQDFDMDLKIAKWLNITAKELKLVNAV